MRKGCDELVGKLCKDLGEDTETCAMVKRETPKFPPERCAQFLKQYDQVLADLQRMEAKNKPLAAEQLAKISADDAYSFGPKDAKVTVVEFSDFQCPYCSRAANVVEQLKEKYSDKVHFVFRHFPLSFHQNAHLASQAAMAANEQGKFFEFHSKMFENQRALERADLEKYATELGLDMDKFKAALDNGTFKDAVDADIKLGESVAVDGTPTLFINGKRAANPTDFTAVQAMIDAALAN
ncbi:MAG: DsbA family protein [Deltaproteobacteria bacterium]|nr:MAG: DsbA family protein [Deltaproteobacteria bacterium]